MPNQVEGFITHFLYKIQLGIQDLDQWTYKKLLINSLTSLAFLIIGMFDLGGKNGRPICEAKIGCV